MLQIRIDMLERRLAMLRETRQGLESLGRSFRSASLASVALIVVYVIWRAAT
jgi:hypothetical protein